MKLFVDGAIYSQMMVLRDPYLDGHEGEWMTDLDVFKRAFRIYWDAGYQIHVHVNGDAGLDRLQLIRCRTLFNIARPTHFLMIK